MIEEFAKSHRLRLTKDDCGEAVIAGRIGNSNIYEYSKSRLGVMFISDGSPRTNLYNKFKAACLEAGMIIVQSGDAEGAFIFDPANPKQAKVAIKGIRARAKRKMTPELLARLATMRQSIRKPLVAAIPSF